MVDATRQNTVLSRATIMLLKAIKKFCMAKKLMNFSRVFQHVFRKENQNTV